MITNSEIIYATENIESVVGQLDTNPFTIPSNLTRWFRHGKILDIFYKVHHGEPVEDMSYFITYLNAVQVILNKQINYFMETFFNDFLTVNKYYWFDCSDDKLTVQEIWELVNQKLITFNILRKVDDADVKAD